MHKKLNSLAFPAKILILSESFFVIVNRVRSLCNFLLLVVVVLLLLLIEDSPMGLRLSAVRAESESGSVKRA